MSRSLQAIFGILFLASLVALPLQCAAEPKLAHVAINDNRIPAGTLGGKTRSVDLVATRGEWFPDGNDHPGIPIEALAERGRAPEIPGPLVRVSVGTDIRLRIRNTLAGETLVVHNLVDLPSKSDRPIAIASGSERVVRIHAYAPGTYYYWATTTGKAIDERYGADSQLSGAIVVDPPGAQPRDRIFVIGIWDNVRRPDGRVSLGYAIQTFNGRSWPATERLSYAHDERVLWRFVNASPETHPLHLHAFPFAVLERGDGLSSQPGDEGREVTERVESGHTMAMRWSADRPGTWMFHCHLAYHVLSHPPTAVMLAGKPTLNFEAMQKRGTAMRPARGMAMVDSMGGMILSVTVRPSAHVASVAGVVPARHLTLTVEPKPQVTDPPNAPIIPALEYVLSENGQTVVPLGAGAPAILLRRGEPVSIEVVNNLSEATSVHWHGIEMREPYYDGVVGFGGVGDRVAPTIEPGSSFDVRFAPPRAGTFIFHTHMDDVWQLAGGLAGPLIVLAPGQTFDPATDHIFMLTTPRDPTYWKTGINVNGQLAPRPIEMTAGIAQKLRLINMTTFSTDAVIRLKTTNASHLSWSLVAKDGMDLAKPRAIPNDVPLSIGQTRDLVFTAPEPGTYAIEVLPDEKSPAIATVAIHVNAR